MTARSVRAWSAVHCWSSIVSTLFLLLLCLTGLPLIFHHELDDALGYGTAAPAAAAGGARATVEAIAAAALAHDPGKVVQYVSWDRDEPGAVKVFTNGAPGGDPDKAVVAAFDAVTAQPLGRSGTGPMLFLLRLHTDLFVGLPGKLFLGAMGMVFIVAIVSGAVLYGPFTRRLSFATIRMAQSRRVVWLDWHNLIGITTVSWALVVGATGTINTWAEPMLERWKSTELAAMTASVGEGPPPLRLAPLDRVVASARTSAPGMSVAFIAFPGTPFSSSRHFAVFMRGDTNLTSRLLEPVLVDAGSGETAGARPMPLYLQALFVSQPLHFGDYGGVVLKLIWALLDVMTIVVLGSGVWLWAMKRRNRPGGASATPAAP